MESDPFKGGFMMRKSKIAKRLASLLAVAAMSVTFVGYGQNSAKTVEAQAASSQIVNIGVTSTLGSLNPLAIDATEINKYSTAMMFLPLVELNGKMQFVGSLADSITTKDNLVFTIHVNKKATWSDGQPVTADDVAFTITRLCSPVIANATMSMYSLKGTNDSGFVAKGAKTVSGIKVIDSKTLSLTMKYKMGLTTFDNSYARYIMTVPKHILGSVTESKLAKYSWFNSPTVVDGPYIATAVDVNHYISYKANQKYWNGAPKIAKMNIKIVTPSQIYSGLKSGGIDFVQPTMAQTPQQDFTSIEKLKNVKVKYSDPVTTQSLFLNTNTIKDKRVREAILYAIDRKTLLKNLLNGKGEVDDGFVTSVSPYYDKSLKVTPYDAAKAKSLVQAAKWDSSKTLNFYVDSGDSTFDRGAQVIQQELLAVGINVSIHTVDLATLMQKAGSQSFDLLAVQYTYAPVDPFPDVRWLLGGKGSWTGFSSAAVNSALQKTQETTNLSVIKKQYTAIDKVMQSEVPMINTYVIRSLGATSTRLHNATPNVYGSFINIQNWQIK
jgi:ABC-type dipeptide transport system, periplasmic component